MKKNSINFYGYDFFINKHVLTPRPETEMIIDATLNLAGLPYLPGVKPSPKKLSRAPTILDVGTGSGCIAITLARKLKDAQIFATDISNKALTIAKKNAKAHHADITFIKSNLLKNIDFTPDLIVANLPYVDKSWPWVDQTALKTDPSLALYAKDGGLDLIKKLIKEAAKKHVKYLVLESDPCQHDALQAFAKTHNYQLAETRNFIQVFTSL